MKEPILFFIGVKFYYNGLQWGDVDSAEFITELLRPPDAPVLKRSTRWAARAATQAAAIAVAGVWIIRLRRGLFPNFSSRRREAIGERVMRERPCGYILAGYVQSGTAARPE